MLSGSVVVHGNASAIAGVAIRGAEVVVRGNIGSRAGQVMKDGSTLCCGGNASFMAGYMMYGGRLIICGDSGRAGRPGHPRRHDLRRRAASTSLGADAEDDRPAGRRSRTTSSPSSTATRSRSPGSFQKIVNAGKNLHYPRTEPRVRVIPFFVGSQRTDYWNAQGAGGHRGQGADRALPHPRLRRRPRRCRTSPTSPSSATCAAVDPDPDVVGKVELATSLGGRFGAVPIDLSMPVMIAPMSYGALSKSTKIALAKASALVRHLRQHGRGRPDPGGARGGQARRRAVPRRPAGLERPRHAPGRRRRDLHLAGRQAGPRRPAHGQEGDGGHRAAARHPGGHRPALAVAAPGRARRRRPRDQGRGVPRGHGLAEAGLGQARRRPRARRHQDRLQGRLRLRLPRRRAGLDRRRRRTRCWSTSASRRCPAIMEGLDALGRDRAPAACRSC